MMQLCWRLGQKWRSRVDNIIILLFSAIVITGLLLLGLIVFTRRSPKGVDTEFYRAQWLQIESSLDDSENSRHIVIVQADKLLDSALKDRGVKGSTMGDRMKNATKLFRNHSAVWAAHKLRNRIVHETSVTVRPQTAQHALKAYKMALKDLGAL